MGLDKIAAGDVTTPDDSEAVLRYLERTSVLALPRVFPQFSPNAINRRLWLGVFLVGVIGTSVHLSIIIQSFLSYEIQMTVCSYSAVVDFCSDYSNQCANDGIPGRHGVQRESVSNESN